MKSILVLTAVEISPFAFESLDAEGESAFSLACKRGAQLPDCDAVFIFTDKESEPLIKTAVEQNEYTKPLHIQVVTETTPSEFFLQISRICGTCDAVFVARADAPFLDLQTAAKLYRQHFDYIAEYSFADGYPEGLVPQILAPGLFPILAELVKDADIPLSGNFIFESIKKDINSFDLETLIAPDDLRHLRLDFYANSKEGFLLCKSFTDINGENYAALISERGECLRLIPAYYSIELVNFHPLRSLYRPNIFPQNLDSNCLMKKEPLFALVKKIAAFSEKAVISLSVFGEPSLHPDIVEIIQEILSYPQLSVLIETSGLGWKHETIQDIARVANAAAGRKPFNIAWIVFLDAISSAMYAKIHRLPIQEANEKLKIAATFTDEIHKLFPQCVWAQTFRMNENEEELEPFFKFWKEQIGQVIIQKYNPLCNKLPDRRVADLSPLDRHPCWHLKRDMTVLTDGTVPLCREDIDTSLILGNAFSEELAEIWKRAEPIYKEHLHADYKGICKYCDEYYTYNF
ncbi:spiro-SPASM protein [Treponema phagedenis]|uniref:spiro-SPASM protein n=1 Tax=Treponema phagedenis TaxID=162 RepID=UPI0011E6F204|nr:spiro-SPASM protein [Treponema phagedenis]QEJ99736.1 spiro-SPASM protein [Treponema phagedenis]